MQQILRLHVSNLRTKWEGTMQLIDPSYVTESKIEGEAERISIYTVVMAES